MAIPSLNGIFSRHPKELMRVASSCLRGVPSGFDESKTSLLLHPSDVRDGLCQLAWLDTHARDLAANLAILSRSTFPKCSSTVCHFSICFFPSRTSFFGGYTPRFS